MLGCDHFGPLARSQLRSSRRTLRLKPGRSQVSERLGVRCRAYPIYERVNVRPGPEGLSMAVQRAERRQRAAFQIEAINHPENQELSIILGEQ